MDKRKRMFVRVRDEMRKNPDDALALLQIAYGK